MADDAGWKAAVGVSIVTSVGALAGVALNQWGKYRADRRKVKEEETAVHVDLQKFYMEQLETHRRQTDEKLAEQDRTIRDLVKENAKLDKQLGRVISMYEAHETLLTSIANRIDNLLGGGLSDLTSLKHDLEAIAADIKIALEKKMLG